MWRVGFMSSNLMTRHAQIELRKIGTDATIISLLFTCSRCSNKSFQNSGPEQSDHTRLASQYNLRLGTSQSHFPHAVHQVDVAAVDLAANRLARPAPTGTPAPPDTATPELPHVTTSLMTNLIVLTCTDQVLTVLKHGMSRNAKKIQEISRKSVAQGSDSDN